MADSVQTELERIARETKDKAAFVTNFILESKTGLVQVTDEFPTTFRILIDATMQLDAQVNEHRDRVNTAQQEFEKSRPDLFDPYHAALIRHREAMNICVLAFLSAVSSGVIPRDLRDMVQDEDFWAELEYSLVRFISGKTSAPPRPKSNPFK